MPAIKINNLNSNYGNKSVIKNLNLTLETGEILSILGSSGCGKSTLLKVIAGLHPSQSGEITIENKLVNNDSIFVPSEKRNIGMIFQDYALFPHLTLAENILFGVNKYAKAQKQTILQQMLELTQLQGLEKNYSHQLSGGQQQRVAIARALACQPKLLLLDEPFSNIDIKVRHQLMTQIRNILKSQQISAIFVTHSKEEAFVFGDKLAIFQNGDIVQTDTPEGVYSSPCNPYVADFLDASNYLPIEVKNKNQVQSPLGILTSTKDLSFPPQYTGQLLLRPQQVKLIANEQGGATILNRQFLGDLCHYQIQIKDYLLNVKSQITQFLPGQRVDLSADKHDLVIF